MGPRPRLSVLHTRLPAMVAAGVVEETCFRRFFRHQLVARLHWRRCRGSRGGATSLEALVAFKLLAISALHGFVANWMLQVANGSLGQNVKVGHVGCLRRYLKRCLKNTEDLSQTPI